MSDISSANYSLSGATPARTAAHRWKAGWLDVYLLLTVLGCATVTGMVAISVSSWTAASVIMLLLVAVCALWISGGAASAIIGFLQADRHQPSAAAAPANEWRPKSKTAVIVLLCGEPATPLADYLGNLRRQANELDMAGRMSLVVLSDTSGAEEIAAEETALAALIADGTIVYRRRTRNTERKPGNIADWVHAQGTGFDFMAILDSDSRMTARRIRSLIYRMEQEPGLGLLQAGISMVPGRSRFGKHQRLANRLLSPNFGRGLAAWSGDAGNYWGHNAIMRVAAFRSATELPVLSGQAPLGGSILSHDFVEAAWIRREGWSVALDPDARGSAEDGPQTLREFYQRDRRWCQGNIQHLRVINAPGLDPVSRLHLASGILGYLVAPVWLGLLLLFTSRLVVVESVLPLVTIALLLIVPKVCALAQWMRRARTRARRRVVLRASFAEFLLSTLIAPLVMLRQCGGVLSVLAGRDCGWKSPERRQIEMPSGMIESALGVALFIIAAANNPASAAWLLPVALPLLSAPLLHRWLDRSTA